MSLIHTAELNGVGPFDYLGALLRHAEEVARIPERWMPWNYREALAGVAAAAWPSSGRAVAKTSVLPIRSTPPRQAHLDGGLPCPGLFERFARPAPGP